MLAGSRITLTRGALRHLRTADPKYTYAHGTCSPGAEEPALSNHHPRRGFSLVPGDFDQTLLRTTYRQQGRALPSLAGRPRVAADRVSLPSERAVDRAVALAAGPPTPQRRTAARYRARRLATTADVTCSNNAYALGRVGPVVASAASVLASAKLGARKEHAGLVCRGLHDRAVARDDGVHAGVDHGAARSFVIAGRGGTAVVVADARRDVVLHPELPDARGARRP